MSTLPRRNRAVSTRDGNNTRNAAHSNRPGAPLGHCIDAPPDWTLVVVADVLIGGCAALPWVLQGWLS